MLEIWGIRSNPLLPSFPSPLWPGVVAPDKGPKVVSKVGDRSRE